MKDENNIYYKSFVFQFEIYLIVKIGNFIAEKSNW
jgi:hypothetical protein